MGTLKKPHHTQEDQLENVKDYARPNESENALQNKHNDHESFLKPGKLLSWNLGTIFWDFKIILDPFYTC